jgi:choline dehydrogenase-like flavoprotein
VGYGKQWQPLIEYCMLAGEEAGHVVNLDNNDGYTEGISIAQFNVDNGIRMTSSTAFLDAKSGSTPKNLFIVTGTIATRLLAKDKQITGLEVLPTRKSGEDVAIKVLAKREVILSAGCFQTPQLLLLSGIGPSRDLKEAGIPVLQDLPAVGKNLQDHSALACEFVINSSIAGHNQLLNDPQALEAATKQYKATKDGPLAMFGASAAIIFPKLSKLIASPEFATIPETTRAFLDAKSRPSTEIWMHSGPLFYTGPCPPDASVLVIEGLCQNNLSRGSLRLASRDPRALPIIDPGYLSHPFDVAIARETVREIVKLADTPTFPPSSNPFS